jgi:predicted kinase
MVDIQSRRFVVIAGLPGSGKTTLGSHLSLALNLPLLDKDDILVRLFETQGTGDKAWRHALSRVSDEILTHEAQSSTGAVIVSFWHLPGMPKGSGTPTAWLSELSGHVIGVRCVCQPDVAAARFIQRQRHPGHLDDESPFADVLASLQAQAALGSLDLEPSIDVDTSRAPDIVRLLSEVEEAFARCLHRPAAEGGQ